MHIILDIEGNGLWPEVDKIWCAVARDISTKDTYRFYPVEFHDNNSEFIDSTVDNLDGFLWGCDKIIMHNGIDYDRRVIEKVLKYSIPLDRIIDTLLLSKLNNPDLKVPVNWKGKLKPHSVEAYGMRFGIHKLENEDWSEFTMNMLYRCVSDVLIQEKIFDSLRGYYVTS